MTERQAIKLLLVEDNPSDVVLVRRLLAKARMFDFGVQDTDYLNSACMMLMHPKDGQFDVIFLDMNLQDSRGIETVTAVHRAAPDVPIVVLSGQEDIKIADMTLKCGATDFVVKKTSMDANEIELAEELERKAVFAIRRAQQVRTTIQLTQASLAKIGASITSDPAVIHAIQAHLDKMEEGLAEVRTYLQLHYPEAWDALQRLYVGSIQIPMRDMRAHLSTDRSRRTGHVTTRSTDPLKILGSLTRSSVKDMSLEEAEKELLAALDIRPFDPSGDANE